MTRIREEEDYSLLVCHYIACIIFTLVLLSFYVSACVTNKPHHNCDYRASGSGSDCDGCVYVFQWKIFVIIVSHLTNFEKCGIKYVNI